MDMASINRFMYLKIMLDRNKFNEMFTKIWQKYGTFLTPFHSQHLRGWTFLSIFAFQDHYIFKGIENWAIKLVPLIMILSRGPTGQIKG